MIRNSYHRTIGFQQSFKTFSFTGSKFVGYDCRYLGRRFFSGDKNDEKGSFRTNKSIWDAADLQRIFNNNREWRKDMLSQDSQFFTKLSQGQEPDYLIIGCSDSRVGPEEIMGLKQGEAFVHRNIANICVSSDLSLLSVIFYAVNILKVKDIFVLGHYGCGGVMAASNNKDLGLIEHWIHNIRDVQRLHNDELQKISDPERRHQRLVELNVQEQCLKLFSNSFVQHMQAETKQTQIKMYPRIHGMVYNIYNGKLNYLDIDFKSKIKKLRDIYTVADFQNHNPIHIDDATHDITKNDHKILKKKVADRLVLIRPNSGRSPPRPLQCCASTTIRELKIAILKLSGSPFDQQKLYYKGKLLSDNDSTLDINGFAKISEIELREAIIPSRFNR